MSTYINFINSKMRFAMISLLLISCDGFLNADLNDAEITHSNLFNDDKNSVGAVTGIYKNMVNSAFAGGGADGISALCGLYSDELHNFMLDPAYRAFEQNDVLATDLKVQQWWSDAYKIIYQANDVLEGLNDSNGITDGVRRQLTAESLFARAFCYFYLVNIFGDVPLATTSDFKVNSTLSRASASDVYERIVLDLLTSYELISDEYAGIERVRPNKSAVSALLARVYLYRGDWPLAIKYSSAVINDARYSLPEDVSSVFVKESSETIWQLASDFPFNTRDGANYIILYGPMSSSSVLSDSLFDDFDRNDMRFISWVGSYEDPSGTLYFPYKYKVSDYGMPVTEHYVVLRLAEQYLIRAEARARNGDLEEAIEDVDKIRLRGKLPLISDEMPDISQADLLRVIDKERRIEFFSEWGHRWFDMKRTGTATLELSKLEKKWSEEDVLFPIPQKERETNPNLGKQNPGY